MATVRKRVTHNPLPGIHTKPIKMKLINIINEKLIEYDVLLHNVIYDNHVYYALIEYEHEKLGFKQIKLASHPDSSNSGGYPILVRR